MSTHGTSPTPSQTDPLDVYVELLGKVEPNLSISVERIVNFGNDFGECYHT